MKTDINNSTIHFIDNSSDFSNLTGQDTYYLIVDGMKPVITINDFSGVLDGNGLSINLSQKFLNNNHGTIKNISIIDSTIYTDSIIGNNYGLIQNVKFRNINIDNSNNNKQVGMISYNDGSMYRVDGSGIVITSTGHDCMIGGLIGESYNNSHITRCIITDSTVYNTNATNCWVGGFQGNNQGYINYSFSSTYVYGSGNLRGFSGSASGDFYDSENYYCYTDACTTLDGGNAHYLSHAQCNDKSNFSNWTYVDWSWGNGHPSLVQYPISFYDNTNSLDLSTYNYNGYDGLALFYTAPIGEGTTQSGSHTGINSDVQINMCTFYSQDVITGGLKIQKMHCDTEDQIRIYQDNSSDYFYISISDMSGIYDGSNISDLIHIGYGQTKKIEIDDIYVIVSRFTQDRLYPYQTICKSIGSNNILSSRHTVDTTSITGHPAKMSYNSFFLKNISNVDCSNIILSNLSYPDIEILESEMGGNILTIDTVIDTLFGQMLLQVNSQTYAYKRLGPSLVQLGLCLSTHDDRSSIQSGDIATLYSWPMLNVQVPDSSGVITDPAPNYYFNNSPSPVTLHPGEEIGINVITGHDPQLHTSLGFSFLGISWDSSGQSYYTSTFENYVTPDYTISDSSYLTYKLYVQIYDSTTEINNVIDNYADNTVSYDVDAFPYSYLETLLPDKTYLFKITSKNKYDSESINLYAQSFKTDSSGGLYKSITFNDLSTFIDNNAVKIEASYNPDLDIVPADTWTIVITDSSNNVVYDYSSTMSNASVYQSFLGQGNTRYLSIYPDFSGNLWETYTITVSVSNSDLSASLSNTITYNINEIGYIGDNKRIIDYINYGQYGDISDTCSIILGNNVFSPHQPLSLHYKNGYTALVYDSSNILFEYIANDFDSIFRTEYTVSHSNSTIYDEKKKGFYVFDLPAFESKLVYFQTGYQSGLIFDILNKNIIANDITFEDFEIIDDFNSRKMYNYNNNTDQMYISAIFNQFNSLSPFLKVGPDENGNIKTSIAGKYVHI